MRSTGRRLQTAAGKKPKRDAARRLDRKLPFAAQRRAVLRPRPRSVSRRKLKSSTGRQRPASHTETDRKSKAYFLQLVSKQPEAKSCLFSLPVSCRYKTPSTGLLTANCRRPCPAIRSVAGPTGAQRVAYPISGSTGIGQAECVKSMGPIEPPARLVLCVVLRLAYDPLPTPPGSLRRHNLRPLLAAFLDVAHREPLGLNSFLRVLLSHLECIWFRPTRQVVSWRIGIRGIGGY